MRFVLIFCLALTGCASLDVPEAPSELRDYQPAERVLIEPIQVERAPQAVEGSVNGEPAACFVLADAQRLRDFVTAANANREALSELSLAYLAKNDELTAILAAGRSAEERAELYRAFYIDAANSNRLTKIAVGGATGLMLLVLSAAAL